MSARPRGPLPGWEPTTARRKGILADLIKRYEQHHGEGTLPRGGRGIFYDLRSDGMGNGVTYRKPDAEHPIKAKDGVPGFGRWRRTRTPSRRCSCWPGVPGSSRRSGSPTRALPTRSPRTPTRTPTTTRVSM